MLAETLNDAVKAKSPRLRGGVERTCGRLSTSHLFHCIHDAKARVAAGRFHRVIVWPDGASDSMIDLRARGVLPGWSGNCTKRTRKPLKRD